MSRSLGGRSFTTRPPIEMLPEVISSRPAMERSAVDLPQPKGRRGPWSPVADLQGQAITSILP